MRATFLVACLVALLAVAGCGGDSRLSKDEFVSKATDICAESKAEIEKVFPEAGFNTLAQVAPAIRKQQEIQEDALGKLEDLEPPSDLEPTFEELIAAYERFLAVIERLKVAAEANRADEFRTIEPEAGSAATEITTKARALDIPGCGLTE